MACPGWEGDQLDREREVGFREVEWEKVVLGHVADAEGFRGRHGCGEGAAERAYSRFRIEGH